MDWTRVAASLLLLFSIGEAATTRIADLSFGLFTSLSQGFVPAASHDHTITYSFLPAPGSEAAIEDQTCHAARRYDTGTS
jgi:hypothetical protein